VLLITLYWIVRGYCISIIFLSLSLQKCSVIASGTPLASSTPLARTADAEMKRLLSVQYTVKHHRDISEILAQFISAMTYLVFVAGRSCM